jgi:hypothetical protein
VKAVLPVIVILGLLASPALGRQWTSRDGKFTVDAEFMEVKDGKVILKQQDGKLVRVPLDKLSQADADFVNDLMPTEMGMGSAPAAKKSLDPAAGAATGVGKQSGRVGETPCPASSTLPGGTQQPLNALSSPTDMGKRANVDINATLADLGSADGDRIRRRLKVLVETGLVEPNPKVAKSLESLLVDSDHVKADIRTDAAKAMKNWSTAENVPAMVTVLTTDKSSVIRVAVIEALSKHRTDLVIGALAQQLSDASTRVAAGKALMAIGPAVEDAVLKRMEGEDAWTRVEACEVLGTIGTKKSLPTLEKATKDPSWLVTKPAEKALDAIKLRERTKVKTD